MTETMVNMGVEPRTLALLAPRSKPTELIDRSMLVNRLCLSYQQLVMQASAKRLRPSHRGSFRHTEDQRPGSFRK
jgi:hypothetical protein